MRNYLLKPGPRSLKVELVAALAWFVFAFAFSRLLHMGAFQTWVILLVIPVGQAVRYVRWHFSPYEETSPPPVTRYTR
mgnify:CR=1 FL=1